MISKRLNGTVVLGALLSLVSAQACDSEQSSPSYTVTIPIRGQAALDFYTIDGDHQLVAGDGVMQVPNVKTPQPFNGNFLELTVLDVTRAN